MIKLFEKFGEYSRVKEWLDEMGIENYTINDDLTVDVGSTGVNLVNKGLSDIPVQFGIVEGNFFCSSNKLTSLKGCPVEVYEVFNCYGNQLTSLEYGPKYVGYHYFCTDNDLTTLKGSPNEINGDFHCDRNNLTSLEYGPNIIDGSYLCNGNKITTLEYSPKKVKYDFVAIDNKITSLKYLSPDMRNINININNPLPLEIYDMDRKDIKVLVKYQEEYGIWNNDGSFNKERFNIFLDDYKAGILS